MTRKIPSTLLCLLAGCAPAAAPGDAPRAITPLTLEPPPIYALLGYRQELSLTSEQIAALDAIAREVRDRNSPLVDSLRSVGDRSGRGFIAVDERSEPLLERVRENHRSAIEEVREVLTEEQEGATCRLFGEAQSRRLQERGQARRTRSRGGIEMPDSAGRGFEGRVWTWCTGA